MISTLTRSEGEADLLMLSGGEPTIHPRIVDILHLAHSAPIKHVMLITNGVRIAKDDAFVAELAALGTGLEVYLQFDSLQRDALINIRGDDLRGVREAAVGALERAGIATTLVCVVKKGVNDGETASLIRFGLGYKCVRGVTFQPVKAVGRNETFNKQVNRITLSDVRTRVVTSTKLFGEDEMIPHPCNPENISIGYLQRGEKGTVKAVTRRLFAEVGAAETRDLFPGHRELAEMLYFLPSLDTDFISYNDLFRVTIVSYLDQFDFCVSAVKRSCIHVVTIDGRIVPMDTYFLLPMARRPVG